MQNNLDEIVRELGGPVGVIYADFHAPKAEPRKRGRFIPRNPFDMDRDSFAAMGLSHSSIAAEVSRRSEVSRRIEVEIARSSNGSAPSLEVAAIQSLGRGNIFNGLNDAHYAPIGHGIYMVHNGKHCDARKHLTGNQLRRRVSDERRSKSNNVAEVETLPHRKSREEMALELYGRAVSELAPKERKKVEWRFSMQGHRVKPRTAESVDRAIDLYFDARQKGSKLSLQDIAELSGLGYASNARRNLNMAGLSAMYWTVSRSYTRMSAAERGQILTLRKTVLTSGEMVYFLGLKRDPATVARVLYGAGPRPWADWESPENRRVTYDYARASQFLQLSDYLAQNGFDRPSALAEAALHVRSATAARFFELRDIITAHIAEAFAVKDPGVKHTLPYRKPFSEAEAAPFLRRVA